MKRPQTDREHYSGLFGLGGALGLITLIVFVMALANPKYQASFAKAALLTGVTWGVFALLQPKN